MNKQSITTRCPGCDTRFRVTGQQLESAGGKVRCGTCLAVFDALECSQSGEPTAPRPDSTQPAELNATSTLKNDTVKNDARAITEPRIIPERDQPARADIQPSPGQQAPQVTPKSELSLRGDEEEVTNTFLWSIASLVAILALSTQILWFERDNLAWHPSFTGIYQVVCTELDCNLPPRQQIEAIRSEALEIKPHPQFKNALSLELLLHNSATFAQPFPALELSFADLKGRTVANRRFQPQDYLPLQAEISGYMSADGHHSIQLEILNPSPRAVNYEIALVAPNY